MALAIVLLSACAGTRPLDFSTIHQFTVQDSADDVRRAMGPANSRQVNDDGSFDLQYQRRCSGPAAERAGEPRLACWEYCDISFSPRGSFAGATCTSDTLPPE